MDKNNAALIVNRLDLELRRKALAYYYITLRRFLQSYDSSEIDSYFSTDAVFAETAEKHGAFLQSGEWYFIDKENAVSARDELKKLYGLSQPCLSC